jgi:hypothetical protein
MADGLGAHGFSQPRHLKESPMGQELQTVLRASIQSTFPALEGNDGSSIRHLKALGRLLSRSLAVPFLLLGMSACREPQFVYSPADGKHLQMCRTFSIEPERNKSLLIWGMRPVSCEAVKPLVAAQLREKGYVQVGPKEADLHVILSSFADESVSSVHSISLVVEVMDRSTRRPLWSGQATLPWTDAPEGSRALQPDLSDFLRPLPASTDAMSSAAISRQARVTAPS